MVDIEKYGFVLKRDFGDGTVIYSYPNSNLDVFFNGVHYTFYSMTEGCRVEYVYMIKLETNKDLEFILSNVRDISSNVRYNIYS